MKKSSLVRGAGFVLIFIFAAAALTCLSVFAFSASLFKLDTQPQIITQPAKDLRSSSDAPYSPDLESIESKNSESIGMPLFMALSDTISDDEKLLSDEIENASGLYSSITKSAIEIDPALLFDPSYSYDTLLDHGAGAAIGSDANSKKYDYASPVPENEVVSDDWFSDALFIGDSRTVGVMNYGGVKSYYYCQVGLSIRGVLTNPIVQDGDDTLTIIQTIEKYPQFKKVYISFGLNELGWDSSVFINTYKHVLDSIRKLLPDAQIYVQAIIPVTEEASKRNKFNVNNERIAEYNALLVDMCREGEYFLIDINTPFTSEDGTLNVESGDGIHLGSAAVRTQLDYLRSHTVDKYDYTWEK